LTEPVLGFEYAARFESLPYLIVSTPETLSVLAFVASLAVERKTAKVGED